MSLYPRAPSKLAAWAVFPLGLQMPSSFQPQGLCPDRSLFLGCSPHRPSGMASYHPSLGPNATCSGDLPRSLSNMRPPHLPSCHSGISCLSFIDVLTVTSTLGCELHGAGTLALASVLNAVLGTGEKLSKCFLRALRGFEPAPGDP